MVVALGSQPIDNPDQAQRVGLFTRSQMTVNFTLADGGKCATYFGRWVSRKGDTGPWSSPVSMSVAA